MGEGGGTCVGMDKGIMEVKLRQKKAGVGEIDISFFYAIIDTDMEILADQYGLFRYADFFPYSQRQCSILHHKAGTIVKAIEGYRELEDSASIIGLPKAVERTRETLEKIANEFEIKLEEIPREEWARYN